MVLLYVDIKIDIHWSFCEQNNVQNTIWDRFQNQPPNINSSTVKVCFHDRQIVMMSSWPARHWRPVPGPAIFQRFRQTTNPVTKEFYHKHDPAKATKESIDTILQKNSKDTHRKGWKWLLVGYCYPDVCSTWNVVSVLSISVVELRKLKSLVMDPTPSLATPGLPKYGATFEKEIWWGMTDASGQKCKMAFICHLIVIRIHWFQCRPSTCMSPIYHSGCRSEWMTVFPQAPDTQMYEACPSFVAPLFDPPFHSHDPWAPRVQRQRQDQRRRSQKKPRVGGLKCHDFPLILLIRFLDHSRFYNVLYVYNLWCFFQFADSMLDYKFLWSQVLLEARICRPTICTFTYVHMEFCLDF